MSNDQDPFAEFRPLLADSLRRTLERPDLSHFALLREQTRTGPARDLPGLLCLLGAASCGAPAERALPAATALALLGEMERVFEAIADEATEGLEAQWGMPRALNAGDAFFNQAQAAVLPAAGGLDADGRRALFALYDSACRAFSETLAGTGDAREARRGILAVALCLGALAGGLSIDARSRLEAAVREMDGAATEGAARFAAAGLPDEESRRLAAAMSYLVEVAGS